MIWLKIKTDNMTYKMRKGKVKKKPYKKIAKKKNN